MYKLKRHRVSISIIVLCAITYAHGPRLIGQYYMSQTDIAEINNYKSIYWKKADEGIWDHQREYALIWCRVRGIEIDEGHIGPSNSERWSRVFDYWKSKNIKHVHNTK